MGETVPCPFCGSTHIRWASDNGVTVNKCMKCHAQGPVARWDQHQGATGAETMQMRRAEAHRLWQKRSGIVRDMPKKDTAP